MKISVFSPVSSLCLADGFRVTYSCEPIKVQISTIESADVSFEQSKPETATCLELKYVQIIQHVCMSM